jgi:hypothetical protein
MSNTGKCGPLRFVAQNQPAMSNRYLTVSKILTAVFALTLVCPTEYFRIPLAFLFLLILFQSLTFLPITLAYFGLISYFLYSGIKKIDSIWDNLIATIAIWASYVLLGPGFEDFLKEGNVVCRIFLSLYLLSSLTTIILTVRQAYQRINGKL